MTQPFPKSILKHGCQTEVTILCVTILMQDLLALQLEFLQPGIQQHVSMLHGHCPQLLMISSSSTHDSDGDDVANMPKLFEEYRNNATSHQSYSILPASNPNDSKMVGPLDPHALFDPEEAYE